MGFLDFLLIGAMANNSSHRHNSNSTTSGSNYENDYQDCCDDECLYECDSCEDSYDGDSGCDDCSCGCDDW